MNVKDNYWGTQKSWRLFIHHLFSNFNRVKWQKHQIDFFFNNLNLITKKVYYLTSFVITGMIIVAYVWNKLLEKEIVVKENKITIEANKLNIVDR